MDPIEFVDYIFHRYQFLGVPVDADSEAIRQAVRRKRAENHTDKLQHVSEEILQVAQRARLLTDECARVLLDDTLRAAFDARLVEFQASAPQLVSTTGMPMIDPTRFRVDVDYLLSDQTLDASAVEQQLAVLSNFDAKRLARARARYDKDPADWTLREDLRAEVTAQYVYLSVLEDIYWRRAGVTATSKDEHFAAQTPDYFLEHLEGKVQRVREHTTATIDQRTGLAQLGFAPPLLLTHAQGQVAADVVPDNAALVQKAVSSFEEKVEALRAVVEQKKVVVQDLVKLRRSALVRSDSGTGLLDIVYIRHTDDDAEIDAWPPMEFDLLSIGFRLDANTGSMGALAEIPTKEQLATWPHALALLEVNSELPGPLLEMMAEADEWLEKRAASSDQ